MIVNKRIQAVVGIFCFCSQYHNLLKQLQTSASQNTLHLNPAPLLQLTKLDLCSDPPYLHYPTIQHYLKQYLFHKTSSPQFKQYQPYKVIQQTKQLVQILQEISKYPYFQLDKQHIRYAYQIFCRALNSKSEEQMNRMLMFVLKCDSSAEESVVYEEFLKYYLGESMEAVKARFQLDITKSSIGEAIKKLAAAIVHRGFLRRTPSYTRTLPILYPSQTLHYTLHNPSTRNSLLLRKLSHTQLLLPIANFYQNTMHNNLYHSRNMQLLQKLTKNIDVIFNVFGNQMIEKECVYLRELYVRLVVVGLGQGKMGDMQGMGLGVFVAYQWCKRVNNQQQKIAKQKRESDSKQDNSNKQENNKQQNKAKNKQGMQTLLQQFLNSLDNELIPYMIENAQQNRYQLNQHVFTTIKMCPALSPQMLEIITQKISPLLFFVYFQHMLQIWQLWAYHPKICAKLLLGGLQSQAQARQTYFDMIPAGKLVELAHKLPDNCQALYSQMVKTTVDKDYKQQPQLQQVISFLQLYSLHPKFYQQTNTIKSTSEQLSKLQTLRIFVFRYVSDQKSRLTNAQIEKVASILLELNDSNSFSDEMGNYDKNIYEELWEVVNSITVSSSVKEQFQSKIRKQGQGKDKANPSLQDLLAKIKNKANIL